MRLSIILTLQILLNSLTFLFTAFRLMWNYPHQVCIAVSANVCYKRKHKNVHGYLISSNIRKTGNTMSACSSLLNTDVAPNLTLTINSFTIHDFFDFYLSFGQFPNTARFSVPVVSLVCNAVCQKI